MTRVRRPGGVRSATAAAFAIAVVVPGCSKGAAAGPAAGPQGPVRTVSMTTVGTIELPRSIEVTGVLAPQEELVVGFQVSGRLAEVRCDVGDAVRADDLLAALDVRDFELDLQRADATLLAARMRLGLVPEATPATLDLETTAPVREARAVVADAELQRNRMQELVRENLRPQSDLDAAAAAREIAESRLQRARDEVRTWLAELQQRTVEQALAQKRVSDARIRAPWPGRVRERHAPAGQYLSIGSPVLTLLRIDPLRLRLQVPDQQAGAVRIGQTARFTVDGSDGEYEGRIARLGAGIDRTTRTLLAEATVPNAEGTLAPGAFCRARIVVAPAVAVVAVPQTAVQSFAGVDRVFQVVEGKARERLVQLGRRAGDRIEVLGGIKAGQSIVDDPRGLVNGMPVTVKG